MERKTDFAGTTFSLKFNSTAYVRQVLILAYRKIPKISPGTYIFQRPFLSGLFLEGLIDWASLIVGSKFTVFALYLRAIFQVQAPGGVISGGAI